MTEDRDNNPFVMEAGVQARPTIASCGHRTRFIVLIQGLLLLSIIMSSIICWNPTTIAITDIRSSPLWDPDVEQDPEIFNDPSLPIWDRRIVYSTFQRSTLFATCFVGALAGQYPMSLILRRLGTHKGMVLIGFLNVLTTVATPFCAIWNFWALAVIRIIQGSTFSNPFPVIGAIVNSWSSLTESSVFIAFLTGFIQISAIFTMPVSGAVSSAIGWPFVFWLHGLLGAIIVCFWWYNFRDEPFRHPFVSDKEFHRISVGKLARPPKYDPPYLAILKTPAIWVTFAATIANFFVAQFAVTFMTMYFTYVAKNSFTIASLISVIPLVAQFCLKIIAGLISDKLLSVSAIVKVRTFNTLAFFGSGIMFIVSGVVPATNTTVNIVLICIAVSFMGLSAGGVLKNAVLVSKQYSPTVLNFVQVIMCLTLFTSSYIATSMTPGGTHVEFSHLFYLYAALLILSNIIFFIWCSAEPAEWTKIVETPAPKPVSTVDAVASAIATATAA